MVLFKLLLLFLLNLQQIRSAKILFGSMHTSRSHIVSMMPVATILDKSGHDVHYLETTMLEKPFKFPEGINNTFISVSADDIFFQEILEASWTDIPRPQAYYRIFKFSEDGFEKIVVTQYEKLVPLLNTIWDLVIVDELFSTTAYTMALRNYRLHKKPYIIFSTTMIGHIFTFKHALGRSIVSRPSEFSSPEEDGKFDITDFSRRLKSVYDIFVTFVLLTLSCECFQGPSQKAIAFEKFSFNELWRGSTYNFLEEINHLAFPSPIASDTIIIGTYCPKFKELPVEFKTFMEDKSSRGTILIAMGSNVSWKKAPQSIINAFSYVLNSLSDYRFIFVYDGDHLRNFLPHIKVVNWSPQWSILNHNSTRLFISHGGLKSVKEAICSTTPMLLLPLFAEQTHNRDLAQKLGIARSLNKLDINPDRMLRMTVDLLTNSTYKEKISRLRKIFADRPMSALEEAKFWANRAIRIAKLRQSSGLIKERPIFKRMGTFLSNFEYFYVFQLIALFICITILSA